MKSFSAFIFAVAALLPLVHASSVSPIGKVVQLLSDLQTKIVAEGAAAQTTYEEFSEWCEHRSKDLGFEIKTGESLKAELEATIAKEIATIDSMTAKIEKLGGDLAVDEADLKAATSIREKEAGEFAIESKELSDIISMLERAVGVLEREMQKGGASMLQLKDASSVTQALSIMVQASVVNSVDGKKLAAFVQSSQDAESDDADQGQGAPDAAAYEGHSSGIIETLESLQEKAKSQLAGMQKKETTNLHNFDMLKQSLEDEIKFASNDMDDAKKELSSSGGKKATAEGDLDVTTKDLKVDVQANADLHHECMTKAQEFEAAVKSRDEELKAVSKAKKIVTETTGGAEAVSYTLSQVSFLQRGDARSPKYEVVRFVRELAKKQSSPALAQLASRMSVAMRSKVAEGEDPFGKVKDLIADMIAKLERDADEDATEKAYCDKELSETKEKQGDKTTEIEKLSTAIDQMSAKSAQLKQEVAELQKALAELAASQVEMDKLREEENAEYVSSKADTEKGLEGVKLALKVLREYYGKEDKAHASGEGAAASIIGLLEVCESDFSEGLAEMTNTEQDAKDTYDQGTKENAIEKTAKEQDVKYKTQESAGLDKTTAEATQDRMGVQAELDAVLEYLKTLEKRCIAVPETYADRKARREAEVAGLKEALSILDGEAVLLQKTSRRTLRAVSAHRSNA